MFRTVVPSRAARILISRFSRSGIMTWREASLSSRSPWRAASGCAAPLVRRGTTIPLSSIPHDVYHIGRTWPHGRSRCAQGGGPFADRNASWPAARSPALSHLRGGPATSERECGRVCWDGLRIAERGSANARRGDPRCPDRLLTPAPARTGRACIRKSPTKL
jgi:hypothetical protein